MALLTKAGTFTVGAGSSQTIAGLGFRPTALVFFGVGASSINTNVNTEDESIGFWAAVGAQTRTGGQYWRAVNAQTPSDVRQNDWDRPLQTDNNGKATAIASTGDGFTITWPGSQTTGKIWGFLAFGGDVQGNVLSITIPKNKAVGDVIAVRGVGFAPSALLAVSTIYGDLKDKQRNATRTLGFGVWDGRGNQWAWHATSRNNANPPRTDRIFRGDALITSVNDVGPSEVFRCAVAAVNPDGFDLSILANAQNNLEGKATILALTGLKASATVLAKPTAAAPTNASITVAGGFTPLAVIAGSADSTSETAAFASNRHGLGVSDFATHVGAHVEDRNGTAPSFVNAVTRNDALYVKRDNDAGATDAQATVTSAVYGGYTFALSANDAVAAKIGLIAFGSLPGPLSGVAAGGAALSEPRLERPVYFSGAAKGAGALAPAALDTMAVLAGVVTAGSVAAAALTTGVGFEGSAAGASDASAPGLRLAIALAGDALGAASVVGKSGAAVPLEGVAAGGAAAASIGFGFAVPLAGAARGGALALAYLALVLPRPAVARASEIPGTVNFLRNSSFEDAAFGVTDWSVANGSIVRSVAEFWHGGASGRVTFNGGATDPTLAVVSQAGLGIRQALPVVGSLRVKGNVAPLSAWVEIVYVGGTVAAGDPVTVDPAAGWTWVQTATVTADPGQSIDYFRLKLRRDGTLAGDETLFVDGAQIEEDRGTGATTFAYGGYRDGFHRWADVPDRSMAIREPIPVAIRTPGVGGVIRIDAALYRATWDNRWLDDLSDYVVAATVTADPTRDVTWQIDCQLLWEGWKKLDPYRDWVTPVLTVTYPDGSVSTGQLGLYLVLDSPAQRNEYGATVHLDARDPLWLVNAQGAVAPWKVTAGMSRVRAAKLALDEAVLTDGDNGRPRYRLPDPDIDDGFRKAREWPRDTRRLDFVNQMVRSAGCYPVWTDAAGIIHTRRRGKDRLKNREPVRTWAANVPVGQIVDARVPRVSNLPSEVVGTIATTPKATDLANEIVVVTDDPDSRIHVRHKVTHPHNPRAKYWEQGRKRTRKIHHPLLESTDTARDVAVALMEELSIRTKTATLAVLPDPAVDLMRETVSCAIWDAAGEEVLVGQYAVLNVKYGFTPADAMMTVELGRIDDLDSILERAVDVGPTSTTILPANASRRRAEIDNRSAAVVWLNPSGTAAANAGDTLLPGQTLIYQTTSAIAGIVQSGTATLGVTEVER